MFDPLSVDQRQRLAALYATHNALHFGELDVWDLTRAAHWVWNGQEMPGPGQAGDIKSVSPDAAMWRQRFVRGQEAPVSPECAQ